MPFRARGRPGQATRLGLFLLVSNVARRANFFVSAAFSSVTRPAAIISAFA
jgi:hypothetical protein